MARTKQTEHRSTGGLPKAVVQPQPQPQPKKDPKKGSGGKPVPVVKLGRIDKRKNVPVKRTTMEEQIRCAQRRVTLCFSKAYFAR